MNHADETYTRLTIAGILTMLAALLVLIVARRTGGRSSH